MPHSKDKRRRAGKIWHKEDSNLSLVEARALKRHLIKTEGKRARKNTDSKHSGKYEVWWATK